MKIYMSFLGFLLFSFSVFAQNTQTQNLDDTSHVLNEVEITATTNPNKKLIYLPQSVVKLNQAELKRGTGLFLDDAINTNVPGVFMEKRSVSGSQQINIRGYGNGVGFRGASNNFDILGTKVYLNGIPVTDAEGFTVMDDIDFGSIGNVEIIKGPAGSLYGLAIAGVVNLQTIKPEKGKVSIGQDILVGSYGLQRYTTHLQIGGDSSSVLVNYGRQLYDGFMPHTASHKDFVNVIADFQPNAKQSVTTYFGYSNSYDERNGELTIGQYDTFNYSGSTKYINNNAHSEVISIRGGIGHTYKFSDHFSNTTSVFASGISNNSSSGGGWTDKFPVNYGLRSTLDMKFGLAENMNLAGTLGLETQKQNAQTISYAMVPDSADLTGYYTIGDVRSNQASISKTTSVFTEWTLTLPKDFALTAGVGMSNMYAELNDRTYSAATNRPNLPNRIPKHYENMYDGLFSPHIALNKVFSKKVSVYASYSVGYKAPVSSQIYIPYTGELNLELKPEKGTQYEIGTKGTLFSDKLYYHVAAFDAIFSDKMTNIAVPDPEKTTTLYTYIVNGGSQDNKGIEALIKYNAYQSGKGFLKSVRPFVNFAYSKFKYKDFKYQSRIGGKNGKPDSMVVADYSGKAVAGVSPITANVGLDIFTKPGFYGNVTYSYRDAMPLTSDGENMTEAFSLVNAKLGFRRSIAKHWDIDAYAGANNITGSQYYQMVFINQLPDAYIPAPNEINFFGGVNLKYSF